jgi:hypothetical protein
MRARGGLSSSRRIATAYASRRIATAYASRRIAAAAFRDFGEVMRHD